MTGESGGSGGGSAPPSGIGGISVSGLTSAGSSFLGKQFSFTSGKSSTSASSGLGDSVISTQPTPKTNEKPVDARSDTSSTSTLTAGSVSSSSKPSSSVLDQNYEQESKYKPVTNFEPQERVNPFDKGAMKSSTTSTTLGGVSTTSSSSISSSSISSRINARTDSNFKSPPPPSRPPPPPPQNASIATNSSTTYQSSTASNKDKTSYIYGSSTSIETITRMDTTTATGNTVSNATASTSLGQSSQGTANTKLKNETGNNLSDWRTAITAPLSSGTRSASVYSAPAAVTVPATASEDAQSTAAASNGYNATTDLPSYTRPSYSRSESNGNYLAVGVLLVSLTLRKS